MKLRFQKDAIVNGINIVMKAVPSKTTMTILEYSLTPAPAKSSLQAMIWN